MQVHNYCRQLRSYFDEHRGSIRPDHVLRVDAAIDAAAKSEKFNLPDGGRILGDKDYRAIDDDLELSLPFERVALEYMPISAKGGLDDLHPTDGPFVAKTIVFLQQDETHIYGRPCWVFRHAPNKWHVYGEFALPRKGVIAERDPVLGARIFAQLENGLVARDVMDEIGATIDFLNALACSNVVTERIDPKRGAKTKGVLPFDSYHVLVIKPRASSARDGSSGSHRSPREHLRRGHIRRLESGIKIWVNATVVNAGIGYRVNKDYRVAA